MHADNERIRVRLAPSPTGPPHVGNAYIGLFDYVSARQAGGDFILRIEDTDRERSSRESEQAIIEAFRWLGLEWDEGPDVGGPHAPYRQSERTDLYREHAEQLLTSGSAYRCFCTREELAARRKARAKEGQIGYDGLCRGLSEAEVRQKLEAGAPHVLRLRVPTEGETRFEDLIRGPIAVENAQVDDQVLLKSDGFPTYHLASVVDDHLMEVTHVIRAEEWISSTPKHILLYEAFGWEPPAFIHMPLLRNKDKSKISKRKNPTSLLWYREEGFLPVALRNFLALMGWSMGEDREVFTTEELIAEFSWDRVKTSGPVFDLQKLEWLNGEHIRALPTEELLRRILEEPYTEHVDAPAEKLLQITELVQERMKKLNEFDELTGFFFEREPYDAEDLIPRKKGPEFVPEVLAAAAETLEGLDEWRAEPLEMAMRELAEQRDWKRGALYMPLRVAVTCRKVSTPLFETMEVLGQQECMERLQ
ncbi:MAG: glutamate--tRNA ligase, partial [Candidatus Brocadiia bacterium]